MKVFVTGAGGFLGRAVVAAAAEAGHQVLALVRPGAFPGVVPLPAGVTAVAGDLRQDGSWTEALTTADAVIHCAAAAGGDLPTQLAGTVLATENLMAALPASLQRLVHVSSFSVYDFDAPRWPGRLDEGTPLEKAPARRDAYTQTKLLQERLVREHAAARGTPLIVIRPGAIYGPGKDWDWGRALRIGPFDAIFAPFSRMRLIHVANCADAIVAALASHAAEPVTVNLVDPEQPSHWHYHRLARRGGAETGIPLPVPYVVVLALGWAARLADRLFFGGRARLPELLDPPRQRVRWRALRYDNELARRMLDWSPGIALEAGIAQMSARAPVTAPPAALHSPSEHIT